MRFASGIDYRTGPKQVWHGFKAVIHGPAPLHIGPNTIRQADNIAEQFQAYSTPFLPLNTPAPTIILHDALDSPLNAPFSLSDLQEALKLASPRKKPGPDGLPYSVYHNLDETGLLVLLRIYKPWFFSSEIPSEVLIAYQVSIPKRSPGEFRPITLLNTILKLFELMLHKRLKSFVSPAIPPYQSGSQDHIGAQDQLANFVGDLRTAKRNGLHSTVLFLDIKKAVDRVDRNLLLTDLQTFGVRGLMLQGLNNCLNGKSLHVLHNGVLNSFDYSESYGVPQGSVLPPCFITSMPVMPCSIPILKLCHTPSQMIVLLSLALRTLGTATKQLLPHLLPSTNGLLPVASNSTSENFERYSVPANGNSGTLLYARSYPMELLSSLALLTRISGILLTLIFPYAPG